MSRHALVEETMTWAELYEADQAIRDEPIFRAVVRVMRGEQRLAEIDSYRAAENAWENEGGASAYA